MLFHKRNEKTRKISVALALLIVHLLCLGQVESKRNKFQKNNIASDISVNNSTKYGNKTKEPEKEQKPESPRENPKIEDNIGTKNKNAQSSNVLEGNTGYISITGTEKQQISVD